LIRGSRSLESDGCSVDALRDHSHRVIGEALTRRVAAPRAIE
jgi:hypothetical protein